METKKYGWIGRSSPRSTNRPHRDSMVMEEGRWVARSEASPRAREGSGRRSVVLSRTEVKDVHQPQPLPFVPYQADSLCYKT